MTLSLCFDGNCSTFCVQIFDATVHWVCLNIIHCVLVYLAYSVSFSGMCILNSFRFLHWYHQYSHIFLCCILCMVVLSMHRPDFTSLHCVRSFAQSIHTQMMYLVSSSKYSQRNNNPSRCFLWIRSQDLLLGASSEVRMNDKSSPIALKGK